MRSRWKNWFLFRNRFWLYLPNYQYFGEKDDIMRLLWKNWFLTKISFFGSISKTINISVKMTIFLDHLDQNWFLAKKLFFGSIKIDQNWFLPKKIVFGSISKTINISGKRTIFWDHHEKFDFCLKNCFLAVIPKLSVFRGKGRYFEITLKKLIFV